MAIGFVEFSLTAKFIFQLLLAVPVLLSISLGVLLESPRCLRLGICALHVCRTLVRRPLCGCTLRRDLACGLLLFLFLPFLLGFIRVVLHKLY